VSQGNDALGLSKLEAVPKELAAVQALYGGEVLLDGDFQQARFKDELADTKPSVVHLATHAEFTGDPATSYVLAGDGKLTLDGLAGLIAPTQFRQPLELLVLSACETAAGDDRAALGLAGVAIRAGARSAMGSLWSISDEAAYEVVTHFYGNLKDPQVSKAEALRRAQLALLTDPTHRFDHPFYWSPYLMISNWL
jgi:CHAT domain-containing protein